MAFLWNTFQQHSSRSLSILFFLELWEEFLQGFTRYSCRDFSRISSGIPLANFSNITPSTPPGIPVWIHLGVPEIPLSNPPWNSLEIKLRVDPEISLVASPEIYLDNSFGISPGVLQKKCSVFLYKFPEILLLNLL